MDLHLQSFESDAAPPKSSSLPDILQLEYFLEMEAFIQLWKKKYAAYVRAV